MENIAAQFKGSDLFVDIDQEVVLHILSKAVKRTHRKGEVIFEKGDFPRNLYLLSEGRVGVYNEGLLLAELAPPGVVGEGFLLEAAATATITAHTDISTLEIRRQDFVDIIQLYPKVLLNIFRITKRRLEISNNTMLEAALTREQRLRVLVDERTATLKETLEELRRTQQVKDQFLANMSHEIRTPMNAIVGLANLLMKTPISEVQEKYINVIRKSGNNLLVIINDILDMAKIEAGKMDLEEVVFNLHRTLSGVETILGLKAQERGIELSAELVGEVPEYVYGDETRLTQILINLAGNAVKFTEEGSVNILISAVNVEEGFHEVHFRVKDTGIGIEPEQLEKIFESFSQASSDTTRKFGGTGLGLNISRNLVQMHGGDLQVESAIGEGSEFHFKIRYKAAKSTLAESIEVKADVVSMKGKKLLLVEDNPFNQMVAEDTIIDLFPDIEVATAADGQAAVDKASKMTFDIILMDIQLPVMDGYEATRTIRSGSGPNKSTPVCALTANVTESGIRACFEAGMNDYMLKPFDPEKLKTKILTFITDTAE